MFVKTLAEKLETAAVIAEVLNAAKSGAVKPKESFETTRAYVQNVRKALDEAAKTDKTDGEFTKALKEMGSSEWKINKESKKTKALLKLNEDYTKSKPPLASVKLFLAELETDTVSLEADEKAAAAAKKEALAEKAAERKEARQANKKPDSGKAAKADPANVKKVISEENIKQELNDIGILALALDRSGVNLVSRDYFSGVMDDARTYFDQTREDLRAEKKETPLYASAAQKVNELQGELADIYNDPEKQKKFIKAVKEMTYDEDTYKNLVKNIQDAPKDLAKIKAEITKLEKDIEKLEKSGKDIPKELSRDLMFKEKDKEHLEWRMPFDIQAKRTQDILRSIVKAEKLGNEQPIIQEQVFRCRALSCDIMTFSLTDDRAKFRKFLKEQQNYGSEVMPTAGLAGLAYNRLYDNEGNRHTDVKGNIRNNASPADYAQVAGFITKSGAQIDITIATKDSDSSDHYQAAQKLGAVYLNHQGALLEMQKPVAQRDPKGLPTGLINALNFFSFPTLQVTSEKIWDTHKALVDRAQEFEDPKKVLRRRYEYRSYSNGEYSNYKSEKDTFGIKDKAGESESPNVDKKDMGFFAPPPIPPQNKSQDNNPGKDQGEGAGR